MTRVFVYGTLLRGESNSFLMDKAKFDGVAVTKPEYDLVDMGWYPAAIQGGGTAIWGEVYLVDSKKLAAIDRLEGLYHRRQVRLADGSSAQLYLYPRAQARGYPIVMSGQWRQMQGENTMRIRLLRDGREFEGTALQIVREMQSLAFGADDKSVDEYIYWMVDHLQKFEGITVSIVGNHTESIAESFIDEIVAHGLAIRC